MKELFKDLLDETCLCVGVVACAVVFIILAWL